MRHVNKIKQKFKILLRIVIGVTGKVFIDLIPNTAYITSSKTYSGHGFLYLREYRGHGMHQRGSSSDPESPKFTRHLISDWKTGIIQSQII